jgi:hypothetical protein
LNFQALLSFPFKFFLKENHEAGLLLAEMIHAGLGQLHVLPCVLQDESGNDEGSSTDREERADAYEE